MTVIWIVYGTLTVEVSLKKAPAHFWTILEIRTFVPDVNHRNELEIPINLIQDID